MTLPAQYEQLVRLALQEDLSGGDLTTESTVDPHLLTSADAIAKAPLVLSGSDVFASVFHAVHGGCRVEQLVPDGTEVPAGAHLFRVEGTARALLMAERTALNFLQRLSGTATLTRQFVRAAAGKVRIADTRKTTPGFRALERRAVRHGGGHNHRDNLGSAVMIKDNHIAAAGGITPALQRARELAPHTCKLEVEVTNLAELDEALGAGADIVMLDNFDEPTTREAVQRTQGRALVELSGNMSVERVAKLADWGADVISVGALTHSAPAADISLRIYPSGQAPAVQRTWPDEG